MWEAFLSMICGALFIREENANEAETKVSGFGVQG